MGLDRIIRLAELVQITGVSKTTLYRWCALGLFPRPVSLGPAAVGWRESVVREWIESREPADSLTSAGEYETPEARAVEISAPREAGP